MQVIDQLAATMIKNELYKADETWRQVHLSTVVLKRSIIKCLNDYRGKKGKIQTLREAVIPPLMTTVVTGMADQMTHLNSLNVVVEPVFSYSEHTSMARSQGELRLETGKIDICLWNHSARQMTLPKQTTVGEITSACVNLMLLVPKPNVSKVAKGKP